MLDRNELLETTRKIDKHLRDVGAVRVADNKAPTPVHWDTIEQAFNLDPLFRSSIQDASIELDLDWVTLPSGVYVGAPGEKAREFAWRARYVRTTAQTLTRRIMLMGRKKRIPDLRKYALTYGIAELRQLPKMLKALGAPLPDEAARALTKRS